MRLFAWFYGKFFHTLRRGEFNYARTVETQALQKYWFVNFLCALIMSRNSSLASDSFLNDSDPKCLLEEIEVQIDDVSKILMYF